MNKSVILIAAAAFALQGCASMNQEECVASDWRMVGYEDGAAGLPGHQIGNYRKACASHGVTPDLRQYQAGRREGLREYCQPPNGFNVGVNGGTYGGACPVDLEEDFLPAYQAGHKLHSLESKVAKASRQITYRERELDRLDKVMVYQQGIVISDEATVQQRLQALLEAKDVTEKKSKLEKQIAILERNKAIYEHELEDYRTTVAYNY
jgi:hypothetical protein